ncbi:MAG: hypothetical protein HDR28_07860 [Lachnospiraceae bacterium]|nr:hypothetical protein [Lachnospiraceae bacterium]
MKNKITQNWGLKLVSFLFAAMLWIIVTNINDPITPFPASDVHVILRNTELITGRGQVYEVLDNTDVIDQVMIYARRSITDSLRESDVVAIADVNDLTSLDTIPIKLSTNRYNDQLEEIRGSIDSVKLNIEEKQTRSLPIRANVTGEVGEGYMLGDVSTEQNLIRVSGPKSVVSRIAKAQAEVNVSNVSGFTSNINTDVEIRLYDEAGSEIRSGNLEKNITKVRVSVEILEKKTVPVRYQVTGTPAEGYRLTGETTSTRNNVVIAGRSKTIQNIDAIEIPEGIIDVTGAREDVTELVDLKDHLPDGTVIAEEDFTGKINITAYVGQEVRRMLSIPIRDIRILGVPAGLKAEITDPEGVCALTLIGLSAELEAIDVNTLEVTVDMTAWLAEQELEEPTAGYHRMPLSVNLPEDSSVVWGETEVQVHITETE